MNPEVCQHEEEITQAIIHNQLSDGMKAHIETCAQCREAMALTQQMQAFRTAQLNTAPAVPHPQVIWLKAQYAQRQKKNRVDMFVGAGAIGSVMLIFFIVSKFLLPTNSAFSLIGFFHGFIESGMIVSPVMIAIAAVVLVLVLGRSSSRSMSF